jgi:hypothetical protein
MAGGGATQGGRELGLQRGLVWRSGAAGQARSAAASSCRGEARRRRSTVEGRSVDGGARGRGRAPADEQIARRRRSA